MVSVVTYREVSAEYFDTPHPRQLKKTLSPGAINIILEIILSKNLQR